MTPNEAIAAIRKLAEEAIAEIKRLNAEEQAIYDRLFHDLEAMKVKEVEAEIMGGGAKEKKQQ